MESKIRDIFNLLIERFFLRVIISNVTSFLKIMNSEKLLSSADYSIIIIIIIISNFKQEQSSGTNSY